MNTKLLEFVTPPTIYPDQNQENTEYDKPSLYQENIFKNDIPDDQEGQIPDYIQSEE